MFITVKQIVYSWLLKREKTLHSAFKGYALAAEAVQELALTSMPLLKHKILTKEEGEDWFMLPDDYTDWVSIGLRDGGHHYPLGVASNLLPFRNTIGGDMGSSFGDDMAGGAPTSWTTPESESQAVFNSQYFNSSQFQTSTPSQESTETAECIWPWNCSLTRYRTDTVAVGPGYIIVPGGFSGTELYLVYVGIGSVDTMTYIPVKAQAVIEAYMDYKYALNKRGRLSEAGIYKQIYEQQHAIYRARESPWTIQTIKNILNRKFGFYR